MTKKLGRKIRERRELLGLSQAEFAKRIGVQASHVAYIESDQRRPSLPLLKRMARVLGVDARQLFFLSHPEAKYLFEEDRQSRGGRRAEENAWRQFLTNRALLKRHRVTGAELKLLEQVSMLSDVSSARDFLFILNTIRQAAEPEG